ncbi:urease accessory protein UreE [Clostridium zeae]|uniref:Urease accessory protein UreE n=1 Tax=Clostridium zeae TaxID=2759022 RepID=A0ABQ1EB65_9CLOT|nr:urease accessory protein UreE [Clostridium zeae]GFZ32045.1 urease accessory protein UreE [Clostridium zeae]
MLVENILGTLEDFDVHGKEIDFVDIEWYEVNKKIIKKVSSSGRQVGIRLDGSRKLNHKDVLHDDSEFIVIVNIPECEAISIKPSTMEEMGRICYEIGNKHIPLFLHQQEILVPYDEPLMKLLEKNKFNPQKVSARLINGLETHSHSHSHGHSHEHEH